MSDLEIQNGSFDKNIVAGTPIKERKIVKVTNALGKLKQLQALQFRYKEEFRETTNIR